MLHLPGPLPASLERLIEHTIGCCIAVHRALGPGLLEQVYSKAVRLELELTGTTFEHEKPIPITYRGRLLCHQRLDLIVGACVLVEIKAVDRIHPVHHAQLLSYLKVSGLRVGLLVNFNVAVLKDGLKRVVL